MSFLDGHLQRRVSHRKRNEFLPVLRPRQPPRGFQPLVERRRGQRREQAKDRQPGRPGANFLQRALGNSGRVVVHAENKRSDGVDVALRQPLEHGGIFARLVESLVHVGEIGGIDGLHADEDPLAARSRDQVDQFFVAQADWR